MEIWVPIKEYQDLLLDRVDDGIAKTIAWWKANVADGR